MTPSTLIRAAMRGVADKLRSDHTDREALPEAIEARDHFTQAIVDLLEALREHDRVCLGERDAPSE